MFDFDTSAVWSACCWRWISSGCFWGDLICQNDSVLLIWWYRLVPPKVSQWLLAALNSGHSFYQETNGDYFPKLFGFEITYLNLGDLFAGFHSKIKALFSVYLCLSLWSPPADCILSFSFWLHGRQWEECFLEQTIERKWAVNFCFTGQLVLSISTCAIVGETSVEFLVWYSSCS